MKQDLSSLTIEELLALADQIGAANEPPSVEIQNASIEELFIMVEEISNG